MQFTPIKDLENFFTKNNYEFFSRFSDTDAKIVLSSRIEPSTQDAKYGRALSFEVYDPLWILARQWQYGRFKGNDCGSIVTAKIRTEKKRLKTVKYGNGDDPIGRLCLHAYKLCFYHPVTHKPLEFQTDIPQSFTSVFRQ